MITGLTHPGISVSNLENWLAFVRKNLNTTHITSQVSDQRYLEKVTGLKCAKLKIGFVRFNERSFPLEVIEYSHPRGNPLNLAYGNTGYAHIGIQVSDINAFHKLHIANDEQVCEIFQINHTYWGTYQSYMLIAPDNIPIKILEMKDSNSGRESPIKIHHTGLTVSDIDSALKLLCGNLNLDLIHRGRQIEDCLAPNLETNYQYAVLKIPNDSFMIELRQFSKASKENQNMTHNNFGSLHHCFQVDDIFNDFEVLKEAGVTFVGPPSEVTAGVNKGAFAIYFYGFDGYRFEIFQRPLNLATFEN